MVFIHGGAFFVGATYVYTPYAFMDTEVVAYHYTVQAWAIR